MSEGAFEGVVTPEATFVLASGVSSLLRASDATQDTPETAAAQPKRGFTGKRNGESPSQRAKRLRIESGEQTALIHLVADVEFGRKRYVLCECGFGCGGASDRAMAEAFDRHGDTST